MTSEIDKYTTDLVGVQEVRWEGGGTLESGNYALFYGEGALGVVTSEIDRCRMDLVTVQEVRWEGSGTLVHIGQEH